MPYKRKGKLVLHQVNGKWVVKQKTTSVINAKKAINLLEGIKHGALKPRRKQNGT